MKPLVLLCGIFFLTACVITPSTNKRVIINSTEVNAEVVSSAEGLGRGLAGVEQLGDKEGMLFIFPRTDFYEFWMKDMLIPLDIIWISDTTVVDLSEHVAPPDDLENQENLPHYRSAYPVNYVLEVRAGFVEENGIEVGDIVKIE